MQITAYSVIKFKKYNLSKAKGCVGPGRTHGAPYRGYGYVPLMFGGGGASLGDWEHNNNKGWVGKEGGGD